MTWEYVVPLTPPQLAALRQQVAKDLSQGSPAKAARLLELPLFAVAMGNKEAMDTAVARQKALDRMAA